MLRTWHTRASAQPLQILPASTRVDCPSQTLSHPGGSFGTVPEPTISRWLIERLIELLLLLDREQRRSSWQRQPAIPNALQTFPVPALNNRANPSGGVA